MNTVTTADILVRCDLADHEGTTAHLTDDQLEKLTRARAALMAGDATAAHAVSLVLDRTIVVPVYRWAQVERDFARIAAKAEARGMPVPVLEELGRTEREVTAHVLGGAPVFNGWRLVAELEQRTNKETGERVSIVRSVYDEECPKHYRDEPERCEHCNLTRVRNSTFVIAHEDGAAIQVGSTCLDEYLGASALSAWLVTSQLSEAADGWSTLGAVWDADEFARYRGHVGDWGSPVPAADFLAAVCAEARVYGFSSSRASAHPNRATGRQVWAGMQDASHERVTHADIARSVDVAAWIVERAPDSDWGHNLRTILAAGEVGWLDANMLASAYSVQARESATTDEHVPNCEVGDRVVLDVRVSDIRSWDDLNWMVERFAVTFTDEAGRQIAWFTTAPGDVEVGDAYRVTAKVKRLGEYRGVAQTEVTRPALREAGEIKKSAPAMRKWSKGRGFDCPEWAWTARMRKAAGE